MEYEIAVENTGPVDTTYDLDDVPTFGAGTTITNIAVSATTPAVAIDPYTAGTSSSTPSPSRRAPPTPTRSP